MSIRLSFTIPGLVSQPAPRLTMPETVTGASVGGVGDDNVKADVMRNAVQPLPTNWRYKNVKRKVQQQMRLG